jgi:hypothetical protein
MLPAGSSETGCEPACGVPIATAHRSRGGHERPGPGIARPATSPLPKPPPGTAVKPNFSSGQPRSPRENETTLPRRYPGLSTRTSRQYSGWFGESLRTRIHRVEKYPLTHTWECFAGPLNAGCSRCRFRDPCERRSGLESSFCPSQGWLEPRPGDVWRVSVEARVEAG